MADTSGQRKTLALTAFVAVALVALLWFLRGRIHFDWHALGQQLRSVSLGYVLAGVAIIYASYWFRSARWAVLVGPVRKTGATETLASQFIGFTVTVLFGRLADLARPYLIARRLGLPVASQLAVYSIERAFDLGAAAVLFSVTLAIAPRTIPHHTAYVRAGALSLAAMLFIAAFALALRFAGEWLAATARKLAKPLGQNAVSQVGDRILDFRDGLKTVTTLREFIIASLLSIIMWGGIAAAYLLSARSFVSDPILGHLSFTAVMLLLATSLGGSLLQLPVLGWFTQIAVVGAAMVGFFGVPLETATACAAVIFFVLNLDIIPAGLIAAHLQGTSLSAAMKQSNSSNVVPS